MDGPDPVEAPEPYELPSLYIPPSAAEVEAAASAAPLLAKLGALRDYLGPDGKQLTDKGNLEVADGRALVEALVAAWHPDLPDVERIKMLTEAIAEGSSAESGMMGFVALRGRR